MNYVMVLSRMIAFMMSWWHNEWCHRWRHDDVKNNVVMMPWWCQYDVLVMRPCGVNIMSWWFNHDGKMVSLMMSWWHDQQCAWWWHGDGILVSYQSYQTHQSYLKRTKHLGQWGASGQNHHLDPPKKRIFVDFHNSSHLLRLIELPRIPIPLN